MTGITMVTLFLVGLSFGNICKKGETNHTTLQYGEIYKTAYVMESYKTCYLFFCKTKYRKVTRLKAGYMVVRCCPGFGTVNDECKPGCEVGMFGANCTHNCNWCPAHCDMGTGSCFCEPGYFGYNCTTECSTGLYGINCEQKCGCSNNSTCNAIDGSCNCTSGWHGTLCDNECLHGTFGPNCKWPCSCNNSNNTIDDSCNRYTGQCTCKSGWTGRTCDKANLDNGERGDTMSTTAKPDYGETGYTIRTTADLDYREQGYTMTTDSRKQNQPQTIVSQEIEFTEPPLTSNNYEQLQNRTDNENRETYDSLETTASFVPSSQPQYESLEHGAEASHNYTDLKNSR